MPPTLWIKGSVARIKCWSRVEAVEVTQLADLEEVLKVAELVELVELVGLRSINCPVYEDL